VKIICTSCGEVLGEVTSTARLILTAHCPHHDWDFGFVVEPEVPAVPAPTAPADTPAT
jgi:hypothetical protein